MEVLSIKSSNNHHKRVLTGFAFKTLIAVSFKFVSVWHSVRVEWWNKTHPPENRLEVEQVTDAFKPAHLFPRHCCCLVSQFILKSPLILCGLYSLWIIFHFSPARLISTNLKLCRPDKSYNSDYSCSVPDNHFYFTSRIQDHTHK